MQNRRTHKQNTGHPRHAQRHVHEFAGSTKLAEEGRTGTITVLQDLQASLYGLEAVISMRLTSAKPITPDTSTP